MELQGFRSDENILFLENLSCRHDVILGF